MFPPRAICDLPDCVDTLMTSCHPYGAEGESASLKYLFKGEDFTQGPRGPLARSALGDGFARPRPWEGSAEKRLERAALVSIDISE